MDILQTIIGGLLGGGLIGLIEFLIRRRDDAGPQGIQGIQGVKGDKGDPGDGRYIYTDSQGNITITREGD